jgi:hypothetical protein
MLFTITVPSDSVRSFKDPHQRKIRIVHALVNVASLPHDIPLEPDPRAPKPTGPVTKRISRSLNLNDGRFHLLNRGICISAKSFELDSRQNILKLDIPEEESYGIIDGGHTYQAIKAAVSSPARIYKSGDNGQSSFILNQQYVHLEILVGIEDYLADIAEARNYSVPLKPWTLANYRDKFEWFLDALGDDYRMHIRVSENDLQPVGILDLIQVMSAVNPMIPSPNESYKNSGKCLEYFVDDNDRYEYQKLEPICRDIIHLYDHIRFQWKEAYNSEDEGGRHGRLGAKKAVTERQRNRTAMSSYYFLDKGVVSGEYPIEKGLALPLISGFRALLEERDGKRFWYTDPFDFFNRHGSKLVRHIMVANDNVGGNPNLIGRDAQIYMTMYSEVRRWYLEDRFANVGNTGKS